MEKDIKITHCFSRNGQAGIGISADWECFTTRWGWNERWLVVVIGLIFITITIQLDWGKDVQTTDDSEN